MNYIKWFDKDKLLMELSNIDGQYYLDGSPIDHEIGIKLSKCNYPAALEVLKNGC